MSDCILYAVADGIATITFNRPRVMNALDPATIIAFRARCASAPNAMRPRMWWCCVAPVQRLLPVAM